jgi:hypothetical protein
MEFGVPTNLVRLIKIYLNETYSYNEVRIGKYLSHNFPFQNGLKQGDALSPLGRPRRRWVDNVKMYLREIGWGGMDWINLGLDMDQWRALVNTATNFQVP